MTTTHVTPDVLTIAEVALELRVSAYTVRRWIREGRIDSVTLPSGHLRIPISALPRLSRARLEDGHRRRDRRELGGDR